MHGSRRGNHPEMVATNKPFSNREIGLPHRPQRSMVVRPVPVFEIDYVEGPRSQGVRTDCM